MPIFVPTLNLVHGGPHVFTVQVNIVRNGVAGTSMPYFPKIPVLRPEALINFENLWTPLIAKRDLTAGLTRKTRCSGSGTAYFAGLSLHSIFSEMFAFTP